MNRRQRRAQTKAGRVSPQAGVAGVEQWYAEAVQHHQAGRLPEAEHVYRQILAAEPRHADALHLLGVIAHQLGRNDIAVEVIGAAIGINGSVAAYHCNLGNALAVLGRGEDAVAAYGTAIRLKPDDAQAHSNLGVALNGLGRSAEAVAAYTTAIRLEAAYAAAHSNMGTALLDLGRAEDAVAAYGTAIRLAPDYAEAHFNLGTALKQLGRFDAARAAFDTAIRLRPDYFQAHSNLGVVLKEAGRFDDAAAAFGSAIRIRPDYADAHCNLGVVLTDLGRFDDAVAAYDAAIGITPDSAVTHYNRGVALNALGRSAEAVTAYAAAIRLKPDYAEAYFHLGVALTALGRMDGAVAAYGAALSVRPDYDEAWFNLGGVLKLLGCLDDAIAAFGRAIRIRPDYADAHSNLVMCLHYQPEVEEGAILRAAREFAGCFETGLPTPAFANHADGDRRLRVGYVSGDFRRHPVGYFLSSVLDRHDPRAVEMFCYSNNVAADDLTAHLQGVSHHWRSLAGLSDQAAAALVVADGIDILVDLSGHTALNRLPMFALKPAPVQVTWLGFWGTTGLAAMDYVLSDKLTIRPGEEDRYSEQVLRLPGGRFCYAPPDYAPPPVARLAVQQQGYVTFGSFNNLSKVGPEVVRLWAKVLTAVPRSRLVLKWVSLADVGVRRRLTDSFAAEGVGQARLDLRGVSPHARMLEEYGDIDIALDPTPFSGALTSCEALWMGVPVITLPGVNAQSRQTQGFLESLGLTGWVAASVDDYVRIAVALASDPAHLSRLRQELRPLMAGSPLCDGPAFTLGLEAVYRQIWRQWCRTVKPVAG
ncbi:MAG TPA: tetratricopeptide repeat protein [Rhodospirillaceae bacterium]|nr:tetratricopeptide repeat protein [Rhodospirillaceae bacterium]